ncbi:MAG: transposase [bacterium]|nr:transposase [bacterium]
MDVGHPSANIDSMRKKAFVTGEFYHIYNRGTDKRVVFNNNYDFDRFLQSIAEFNSVIPIGSIYENSFIDHKLGRPTSKLVNIVCYCLNPNHYHMILEQCAEGGISEFMKRLSGGYTKYFNNKYKRNGVLFQGRFKSSHIDSNEYLLHASAYVNLNNRVHKLKRDKFRSSLDEFIYKSSKEIFCKKDIILKQFKSKSEYEDFVKEALDNMLTRKDSLKEMENLLSLEA